MSVNDLTRSLWRLSTDISAATYRSKHILIPVYLTLDNIDVNRLLLFSLSAIQHLTENSFKYEAILFFTIIVVKSTVVIS